MNDRRADPDALLRELQAEEKRARRGKLKIFFGASAGVGKTYAMLEAALRKRTEGVDVVAGYVEPHGRVETERLLEGLDRIAFRAGAPGTDVFEFDLDRALARRPALILVDELAHTNAEGARHAKRWQDIEELRDAGIDVYTTLNVQHLESLNDVVAGFTGARQQETVPDSVFESADEVELVDIAPDDLLQRLREGKVYVPQHAQLAIENFFRKGNLIALRELALRKTAERVDAAMERWRRAEAITQPWLAGERLLVGIGQSSDGETLVRAGKRLATALRAPWIVVYVETPDLIRLPAAERNRRIAWLRLAETLGAETVTLGGASAADELVEYARTRNVSRILLGEPSRRGWRRWLRSSTVDGVLARARGIDVSVVKTTEAQRLARSPLLMRSRAFLTPAPPKKVRWPRYAWTTAVVLIATLLGLATDPVLNETNTAMLYLAGIILVAWRFGRGPSFLASVLSVATYNFFFIEPIYTFNVADGQYLITFAVIMAVGLLVGQLMQSVRLQARVAGHRERRTALLYAMSRELASIRGVDGIARVAVAHIGEVFESQVTLLLPDEQRRSRMPRGRPEGASLRDVDLSVAQWVQDHGKPAGLGTDTLPGAAARYVPLAGTVDGSPPVLGVLAVLPANPRRILLPEQAHLLDTFASQVALALERAELAEQAQTAQVEAETESVRNSLLAAISHDMRTPLAVIGGAASSLAHPGSRLDPATRRSLAQSIVDESSKMTQLISNVLDMTRLESGRQAPRLEWIDLEEVIGSALNRLAGPLDGYTLTMQLERAPRLIRADPVLLEQLFLNLLENVTRHAPPGTRVSLTARRIADTLEVLVADDGPGFPSDVEPDELFAKFKRGRDEGATGGVGLGLAICRAIAQAHGGDIRAERIPAGGALFVVSLPLADELPELPVEANES
jgi:two-component system sensor histidine kinase KdpD